MLWFYIFIFIISCALLFWSSSFLINALMRIGKFLGWREFVVAFFIMAFAASLPNLFVGINSALHKIPELSFGDIVGGNLVDLTLAIAAATLVAGGLPVASRTIQTSSIFTFIIAILPLALILDGVLGRGDGIALLLVFAFYIFWLFSKKERFQKIYEAYELKNGGIIKEFKVFIKDIGRLILGIILLLLATEGMIRAASFFAERLNLPLSLIGILIVGLGNALPETYFAIVSAKKGETWMILGDLMGTVIVAATLVLGIVALICPIKITDFSPFAVARFFLIISALFFFFFVRTGRKITRKEAAFLLGLYILFILIEILTK